MLLEINSAFAQLPPNSAGLSIKPLEIVEVARSV
jgi:hypothetical protein